MNVECFNETLLSLYRGCRNHCASTFKEWALQLVRTLVHFDSGVWSTANVVSREFQSVYLYQQPATMFERYQALMEQDELARASRTFPGRTVDMASLLSGTNHPVVPDLFSEFRQTYGISHALCTYFLTPVSGIGTYVSVFRADATAPFSEDERKTLELLMPHLIESFRINLFSHLHNTAPDFHAHGAVAICDAGGMLYEAQPQFLKVLSETWPDWTGPRIALEPGCLNADEETAWSWRGLEFRALPLRDLFVLMVRRPSALNILTQREFLVAELLKEGLSYKDVARELGISHSTVTNHANHIYAKLGIKGRMGLAALFR